MIVTVIAFGFAPGPAPRPRGAVPGNIMRCWMSTGAGISAADAGETARGRPCGSVTHLPAPLKNASPAARSPTRMSPTVKSGDERIVSFTR